MHDAPHRTDVFALAFRNYWWASSIGGLYFVVGFVLWGGSRAALVSSSLFVVAAAIGLVLHYTAGQTRRAVRLSFLIAHLLVGQGILIWQQANLPLTDYTTTGNPAVRDLLVYLVSALFVGTMSMFGGFWGALLSLASHYAFFFNPHEEFSFKWVFPVLIATGGAIVSTALWHLDEAYGKLAALADSDHLTGLFNRHRLTSEFERLQAQAKESGAPLVLIAWDLDDLKQINDTQGHAAGDACIRGFASALRATVRTSSGSRSADAAFRVGGDEFISLHLDTRDGEALLQRVHRAGHSVSAGWVRCEQLSLDQALTTADQALYAAKDRRKQMPVG